MAGEARRQEHETAGHMASTVRKQREVTAGAPLTGFCSFCTKIPDHDEMALPSAGRFLPLQ